MDRESLKGIRERPLVGSIEDLLRVVRENQIFLVASHVNPEGDAIGSALALAEGLERMGKEVTIFFDDRVPYLYSFMPHVERVTHDVTGRVFDVTIAVDCGELERLGKGFERIGERGIFVNIDHHSSNDLFGDINIVDEDASATGEMIYRILKGFGVPITSTIATNLYVALLMDTGSFRYSSATPEAFRIAAELVEKGVNPWEVAKRIYESHPVERLRLLGQSLGTIELRCGGRLAIMVVTRQMYESCGATEEMTESFVNYPRSIKGVKVAVFMREIGERSYKFSLRAKEEIDVSRIAALFGGGGHRRAAGCVVEGDLEEVKERMVKAIERFL